MTPATARKPSTRQRAREAREEARARIISVATDLVRERSYAELSVGEIMERAGIGRTIFYRHFDDLNDLLARAGLDAANGLFAAARRIGEDDGRGEDAIRPAMEAAVAVYRKDGPVLRALAEAAAAQPSIADGRAALRGRMDELVAQRLREMPDVADNRPEDVDETARALTALMTSYMLDAYGYKPRVTEEVAVNTMTEIWVGAIRRGG